MSASLCFVLLALETVAGLQPFTVADSIAMNVLVDPSAAWTPSKPPEFNLSPDSKALVVVTKRGNLDTGRNEFTLSLISTTAVRSYVNAQSGDIHQPVMRPLVKFETSSTFPGIDEVAWLPDSRRVIFIGRGPDEIGQVYTYDVGSSKLTRLTSHERNIVRFALSANEDVLVYSSHAYEDWAERNKRGYAVQSEYSTSLAWTDPTDATPHLRYFSLDLNSSTRTEIRMGPSLLAQNLSISPSGNWAIVTHYDVTRFPEAWFEYDEFAQRLRSRIKRDQVGRDLGSLRAELDSEAFGGPSDWAGRRMLINTRTGDAKPLVDAPVLNDGTDAKVVWSSRGGRERVLVAPTLPSLSHADVANSGRVPGSASVAFTEFDVSQDRVVRVVDSPMAGQPSTIQWLPNGDIAAEYVESTSSQKIRKFLLSGRRWREVPSAEQPDDLPLRFYISQDMNTPYELAAEDVQTKRARTITELNPQLRTLKLGTVQKFEWSDSAGRTHKGGLLLPPDYRAGRRYPAVLQTYGFRENRFLVDGPSGITAAYAARPMANAGMIVLQMDTRAAGDAYYRCANWEICGERATFLAIVESAIHALDERGLIDPDRVGLIGWSREGMRVFDAVTFGGFNLAAATVADSVAYGPFAYAMMYGLAYPGMAHVEEMMGAEYWQAGIDTWQQRSPTLNLHRIQTPLRLESYGKAVPTYWDVFAVLKRQRRPVELIHIPLDTHLLQTPHGRLTSQQGNVDWFRFWLKDEVDEDPTKADQYRRWRRLKQQHQSLLQSHTRVPRNDSLGSKQRTAPTGWSQPTP